MSGIENYTPQTVIGTCSCCDETIYYDEEIETYKRTADGQLLCWDCYERLRDERKA